MTSHLQTDDPLLKPPLRRKSSTHTRSIIPLQSILNPTDGGKRLAPNTQNRNNNMTMELLRPPTLPPSPQQRSSSSPLLAPISKSISAKPYFQRGGGSSISPPHPPRRIITPVSPALRHASIGRNNNIGTGPVGAASNGSTGAGKAMISQLLFVQEQQHRGHLSGGLAGDAASQTSGPSTPHSTFSSFVPSPCITSGILPPLGQSASLPTSSVDSASQSPYMGMDPVSRTPSRISGPSEWLNQDGSQVQYSTKPMIPVTIDLKSGSRSQAEKRKANSDASMRFRNRKKNEAALGQRINQLNEQLQFLADERDFYRNERDFFRDTLGEHIDLAQMPPRPPSPAPSHRYTQSIACPSAQPSPVDLHQQAIAWEER